MNSSVIIVAAGKGKRFREKIPKQYVNLGCESIINLTIKNFLILKEIKYILPVINKKHLKFYNNNINKLNVSESFKKILHHALVEMKGVFSKKRSRNQYQN